MTIKTSRNGFLPLENLFFSLYSTLTPTLKPRTPVQYFKTLCRKDLAWSGLQVLAQDGVGEDGVEELWPH